MQPDGLQFDGDMVLEDLSRDLAAALLECAKLRSIIKRDILARATAPAAAAETAAGDA